MLLLTPGEVSDQILHAAFEHLCHGKSKHDIEVQKLVDELQAYLLRRKARNRGTKFGCKVRMSWRRVAGRLGSIGELRWVRPLSLPRR